MYVNYPTWGMDLKGTYDNIAKVLNENNIAKENIIKIDLTHSGDRGWFVADILVYKED